MSRLGGDISRQRGTMGTGWKKDPWDRDKTALKSSVKAYPDQEADARIPKSSQPSQDQSVGAAAFGGPSLPSFSPYSLLPTPKGQNEAEELRAEARQRTQLAKGVSPGELARKAAVNETRTYQPTNRDLERPHDVFEEEIAEVDQLIKKAFSNTEDAFPDGETAERIRELRHWKELLESQRDELADLPSPTVSTDTTAEEAVSRYEAARKALVQDTMSSYAAAAGGKKPSGPAPVASTYAASAGALKSEEEREREARLREVGQAYAALPFPSVGERVGLTLSGAGKQFAGSMAQAEASVVDTIGLDGLYHYFSGKSGPYIPNPMVRSVLSPFEKRLINDVEGFSDKASESGAQDIAKAREGLDPAGKMLVSAGVGVTQMGGDAILSLATGGSALWFMLTRAFGGGVQEAKAKGYGREQQALLGLTSAATEYFTERLFGGNPVYDTDAGLINRMVGKLVKNPTVMEFLSSAPIEKVTEGLEEIVSGLLNPMAEWAITGTRPEYELDQIIEDGIVGVITALIAGGGTQVVNKVTNLVSDATADKLLLDRNTVDFLRRKGGLKLNKKMTHEQKRAAVRQAVNQIVEKKKENTLPKDTASDIIEADEFTIHVGVGAKGKNYDVMDLESGEMYHFVEGSKVQDVKVFAGKSSRTPFRRASFFAKRYGGVAEDWQHVKGYALLETPDGDRMAEVHWVQCREIGKFEFFVKEWLD